MSNEQKCRIKICGFKEKEHLLALDGLAIDEVGFVFAKSKRQVSSEQAAELIKALQGISCANGLPPLAVGVLVDMDLSELKKIMERAPLQIIQLHGHEDPSYCRQVKRMFPTLKTWKVFSVKDSLKTTDAYTHLSNILSAYNSSIDAVLLDAPGGGTGQVFGWEAIAAYQQICSERQLPLYIAGGLNADNVRLLLEQYAVDGVDVSSGVETNGRKDSEKIHLFVKRVREA